MNAWDREDDTMGGLVGAGGASSVRVDEKDQRIAELAAELKATHLRLQKDQRIAALERELAEAREWEKLMRMMAHDYSGNMKLAKALERADTAIRAVRAIERADTAREEER